MHIDTWQRYIRAGATLMTRELQIGNRDVIPKLFFLRSAARCHHMNEAVHAQECAPLWRISQASAAARLPEVEPVYQEKQSSRREFLLGSDRLSLKMPGSVGTSLEKDCPIADQKSLEVAWLTI